MSRRRDSKHSGQGGLGLLRHRAASQVVAEQCVEVPKIFRHVADMNDACLEIRMPAQRRQGELNSLPPKPVCQCAVPKFRNTRTKSPSICAGAKDHHDGRAGHELRRSSPSPAFNRTARAVPIE